MSRFKQTALCTVTLATIVLAGCSTTQPTPGHTDLQRSAMQRWNACLARNASSTSATSAQIGQLLRHHCEGHKRDVVATFPKYMAKQIDQMLISSAYQFMDPDDDPLELSSQQGELVQALLR